MTEKVQRRSTMRSYKNQNRKETTLQIEENHVHELIPNRFFYLILPTEKEVKTPQKIATELSQNSESRNLILESLTWAKRDPTHPQLVIKNF